MAERVFSVRYLGDSKALGRVRGRIESLLGPLERFGIRDADPERPETGAPNQYQYYHAIYASGDQAGVPGREDAARWRRTAIEDGVIGPLSELK